MAGLNTVEREGKTTVLDFEDALRLLSAGLKVHFAASGYALVKERGNKGGGFTSLHRWLMGAKTGQYVDHINGDKLDNRRNNLRLTTQGLNRANSVKPNRGTSPYKGVCFQRGKWRARVIKDRQYYHCGFHDTAEQAARAYDEKALELFGEFANLNFKPKR